MSLRALAPTRDAAKPRLRSGGHRRTRGSGIPRSGITREISVGNSQPRRRDRRQRRLNLAEFILSAVEGLGVTSPRG